MNADERRFGLSSSASIGVHRRLIPPLLFYVTGLRGISRVAEAFAAGVDFVQLRAKDFSGAELFRLAGAVKGYGKLLVNDRLDVALASGAAGVHLPSNRPPVTEYRQIVPPGFIISVACHSAEDVERAAREGADYALLAPIFDTPGKGPGIGLAVLKDAARAEIPVIALGGVTIENAASCIAAGASGIAAIRLFEEAREISSVTPLCRFPRVPDPSR